MSNLVFKGIKNIEGMTFHDIEGGFGEGKKAMLVKEIANIHGRELSEINRRINENIIRFKDSVDIVDLKSEEFAMLLKHSGIYTQNSINASKNIYLLSERGYSKLLKILEDDVAWEQYDKLVDGYFQMREERKNKENKPTCIEDVLISSLQEMKAIKQQISQANENALSAKAEVKEIREIVQLDTTNWRSETSTLLSRIAINQGGFERLNKLRNESYDLLDKRLGVDLERRLTNRRRVMVEEGVSKSKREKVNYLDVIAGDKKLIEGYVAIVKDMAIKYGISKKTN